MSRCVRRDSSRHGDWADPWAQRDPWQQSTSTSSTEIQSKRTSRCTRPTPCSSNDVMWALSGRIGSAYRIAKGDMYLMEDCKEEYTEVLNSLAGTLQLLGRALLPESEKSARTNLVASRPEVRDLANLLALLAKGSEAKLTDDDHGQAGNSHRSVDAQPPAIAPLVCSNDGFAEQLDKIEAKLDMTTAKLIEAGRSAGPSKSVCSSNFVELSQKVDALIHGVDIVLSHIGSECRTIEACGVPLAPPLAKAARPARNYRPAGPSAPVLFDIGDDSSGCLEDCLESSAPDDAQSMRVDPFHTLPSVGMQLLPPTSYPILAHARQALDPGEQIISGAPRALWDQLADAFGVPRLPSQALTSGRSHVKDVISAAAP